MPEWERARSPRPAVPWQEMERVPVCVMEARSTMEHCMLGPVVAVGLSSMIKVMCHGSKSGTA